MMNNPNIYKYRFDELLKNVKRNSKYLLEHYGNNQDDELIDICGNDFYRYRGAILNNERCIVTTIEKIVVDLLIDYDISYTIPEYEMSINDKIVNYKPFSFVIIENEKKVAYSFGLKNGFNLSKMRKQLRRFMEIDSIKYYFIQNEKSEDILSFNTIEQEKDNSFLQFFTIKDFFYEKFGKDEFDIFKMYANDFSEQARNIIGFKIIAMPTPDVFNGFKKKKLELLSSNYSVNFLNVIVSSEMKDIIINNYLGKQRYKLLLGDEDFADSFMSSEWYYGIHTITDQIDQTGLVTGYLKSVEQLLYDILKLSWRKPKNRWIQMNLKLKNCFNGLLHDNNQIDFNEINEEFVDKSLGSLIHFIKKKTSNHFFNNDLFDVNDDTIQLLINSLYEFKDKARNDHLHKDNIYTEDEVNDIRNSTLQLYVLILGCFKIEELELINLGLSGFDNLNIISEEELYYKISEWTTSVIKFDMPKNAKVVAFFVKKWNDKCCELNILGLHDIPKDKYNTIEWNNKRIFASSNLTWESDENGGTVLNQVINILEKYILEDERSKELKLFPEIVVGNIKVEKILKKIN